MMPTLTPKQAAILNFIKEYLILRGYAPSLMEIGAQFDLSSLATVHKHLENLQAKGYITRRWNGSRSMQLTELTTGCCPYCKRPLEQQREATV